MTLLLVGACVLLASAGFAVYDQYQKGKAAAEGPLATESVNDDIRNGLLETYADSLALYRQAPNDIKRSEIHNDAREIAEATLSAQRNELVRWKGTLDRLETITGGRYAKLVVTATHDDPTVNVKAVFTSEGTLGYGLEHGSPVYEQAASLREGDCVHFSGTVREQEVQPEKAALTRPTFAFEFVDIEPC